VARVLAWAALPLLVASVALFLLPVTNPQVQHCGSPAVFLLRATADKSLINDDGTALHGWTQAQLDASWKHRCSVRVAARAVPAGGLLVAFWAVAGGALVTGWIGRRRLRRPSLPDEADADEPGFSPPVASRT
jgi:hypothetical protein